MAINNKTRKSGLLVLTFLSTLTGAQKDTEPKSMILDSTSVASPTDSVPMQAMIDSYTAFVYSTVFFNFPHFKASFNAQIDQAKQDYKDALALIDIATTRAQQQYDSTVAPAESHLAQVRKNNNNLFDTIFIKLQTTNHEEFEAISNQLERILTEGQTAYNEAEAALDATLVDADAARKNISVKAGVSYSKARAALDATLADADAARAIFRSMLNDMSPFLIQALFLNDAFVLILILNFVLRGV